MFAYNEVGNTAVSAALKIDVEYDCDWDMITFDYDHNFSRVRDQDTPAIMLNFE